MDKMELQQLTFFTEGNTYTGIRTKDPVSGTMLRYLVRPDKENKQLCAFAWRQDVCFERAKDPTEGRFPMSEEGLEQIGGWLAEQYEAL